MAGYVLTLLTFPARFLPFAHGHPEHDEPEAAPRWSSRLDEDPLAFYQRHYPGVTRTKLFYADHNLYQVLIRRKLIEHVPRKNRVIKNALAYYRKHYARLTRGELRAKDISFYQILQRRKLLHHVPPS